MFLRTQSHRLIREVHPCEYRGVRKNQRQAKTGDVFS